MSGYSDFTLNPKPTVQVGSFRIGKKEACPVCSKPFIVEHEGQIYCQEGCSKKVRRKTPSLAPRVAVRSREYRHPHWVDRLVCGHDWIGPRGVSQRAAKWRHCDACLKEV